MDDLNEEIQKIAKAIESMESEKYPTDIVIGFRTGGGGFCVVGNEEADNQDLDLVREAMKQGDKKDVVMMLRLKADQRQGRSVN
jgi:hypothetical protein